MKHINSPIIAFALFVGFLCLAKFSWDYQPHVTIPLAQQHGYSVEQASNLDSFVAFQLNHYNDNVVTYTKSQAVDLISLEGAKP